MTKNHRLLITALLLAILVLSACAPSASTNASPTPEEIIIKQKRTTATPAPQPLAEQFIPPYYLPSYSNIVNASKLEQKLVIHSILSNENWEPIIHVFNSHYPWIKVETIQVSTAEAFTKYISEKDAGQPSADIIISSDVAGWYSFVQTGEVLTYRSQEEAFLPPWATQNIGIYPMSTDPVLIIYNKNLVPKPPTSMQALSEMVTKAPTDYQEKIITYDAETNQSGFAINWFWLKKTKETGWEQLIKIGTTSPVVTPDRNEMVKAVLAGTAKIGYFVTSVVILPNLYQYPNIGYSYIEDGQPVFLRYMAITQNSANKNAAKLMVDFLLSQEGQIASSMGGLTAYRSDIAPNSKYHLNQVEQSVGVANLIFLELDPELVDTNKVSYFMERWKLSIGKTETPAP